MSPPVPGEPSERAPFSEAAREAAARALRYLDAHGVLSDGWAPMILTAAVDADPRAKAGLKLASLSDEERERLVADALVRIDAYDPALLSAEERSMFRVSCANSRMW